MNATNPCVSSCSSRSFTRWSTRSEEHTSELQSQSNLVCRLLLENKNQQPDKSETGRRLTPGPLKYDHFEVDVGADGFPVELGAGAMAITYRARDTVLISVVALKVIDRRVAQNPGARSRFLREARTAAQIRHPNVARVTHYGEQDGECFY